MGLVIIGVGPIVNIVGGGGGVWTVVVHVLSVVIDDVGGEGGVEMIINVVGGGGGVGMVVIDVSSVVIDVM